jgi:hypothetical protein
LAVDLDPRSDVWGIGPRHGQHPGIAEHTPGSREQAMDFPPSSDSGGTSLRTASASLQIGIQP